MRNTLAALAALAVLPGAAGAATIDFEALAFDGEGAAILGGSYGEDGFTLAADPPALGVHGRQSVNFAGSTGVFDTGGMATLRRDDGRAFALQTVALVAHASEGPARVDVWAGLPDGGAAVQTFLVDGTRGFATYALNGGPFDAVLWIAFARNATALGTGYQVDDIVLAPASVAPVPLPASLLLLAAALGAVAVVRRAG